MSFPLNHLVSLAQWAWSSILLPSLSDALSALVRAIANRLSHWAAVRLAEGGIA